MWFTKASFARSNPQVIDAFIRSMKEAVDYLRADEARARDAIAAYTQIDRGILDSMPLIGWNYQVRLDRWQAVVDMMVRYGGLKPRKADEYMTPQLEPFIVK